MKVETKTNNIVSTKKVLNGLVGDFALRRALLKRLDTCSSGSDILVLLYTINIHNISHLNIFFAIKIYSKNTFLKAYYEWSY